MFCQLLCYLLWLKICSPFCLSRRAVSGPCQVLSVRAVVGAAIVRLPPQSCGPPFIVPSLRKQTTLFVGTASAPSQQKCTALSWGNASTLIAPLRYAIRIFGCCFSPGSLRAFLLLRFVITNIPIVSNLVLSFSFIR